MPPLLKTPASLLNLAALERELRDRVRGEVRFDEGSRALYAIDASNYRQVSLGVVLPKDAEDVVGVVAICRRFDAPLLSETPVESDSHDACFRTGGRNLPGHAGRMKNLLLETADTGFRGGMQRPVYSKERSILRTASNKGEHAYICQLTKPKSIGKQNW